MAQDVVSYTPRDWQNLMGWAPVTTLARTYVGFPAVLQVYPA